MENVDDIVKHLNNEIDEILENLNESLGSKYSEPIDTLLKSINSLDDSLRGELLEGFRDSLSKYKSK